MPKVSICIPAYNNERSIERLLKSIYNQTYKDYEIVITDDSNDNRVKELVSHYPDVRYYKNEKRLGSTANWNEAVSKSHGDYIKIMHHDDWFSSKDSLKQFVQMLDEHKETDIAFSGTWQYNETDKYARHIVKEDAQLIKDNYKNLFLGNTIGAPSAAIYRKSNILFDQNLTWLVDMEFYMGILKKNPNYIYTEEPLISIGMSKDQLTESCISDKEINIREYGNIYVKHSLNNDIKYRKKMLDILMQNDADYNIAKNYEVSPYLYYMLKCKKILSKIAWKLGFKNG